MTDNLPARPKRHKADDIKHGGALALSDAEIQDIPPDLIFQWVRAGKWKLKDWNKWLKAIRVIE